MKTRLYTLIALLALSFSAQATLQLVPDNVNTNTNANANAAAASANAGAVAGAVSGSLSGAISASQGGDARSTTGASTSAATNGNQTVNFNAPADTTTRASGTTEVRTVATVFAPDMVTTATCMVGASGGATGLGWGFAIGTGIEDKGCTRRENARLLKNLGKAEAAVKIMCNDPEVAAALGADCAVAK